MTNGEINEIIKKLLSDPQFYAVFKEQIMASPANMKKLVASTEEAIRAALLNPAN